MASDIGGDAGASIRQSLKASLPHDFPAKTELKNLAVEIDRFPEPWMSFPVEYRKERFKTSAAMGWGAIVELPYKIAPEDETSELENFPRCAPRSDDPIQSYVILLDWSLSDKVLLDSLKNWLQNKRPKSRPGSWHTGKASAPPFHWLKQLAARRLAASGLSHTDAKQLIAARRLERRINAEPVLPNYGGTGAWSNAIREAEELLTHEDPFWQIMLRCHHMPGELAVGK